MLVPQLGELEDLVQGHVCHPEASLVVDGQPMGHVELGRSPGPEGFPRGREVDESVSLDGSIQNVLIHVVISERAGQRHIVGDENNGSILVASNGCWEWLVASLAGLN